MGEFLSNAQGGNLSIIGLGLQNTLIVQSIPFLDNPNGQMLARSPDKQGFTVLAV